MESNHQYVEVADVHVDAESAKRIRARRDEDTVTAVDVTPIQQRLAELDALRVELSHAVDILGERVGPALGESNPSPDTPGHAILSASSPLAETLDQLIAAYRRDIERLQVITGRIEL